MKGNINLRLMLEARAGGILFLGLFGSAWALEAAIRLPMLFTAGVSAAALAVLGGLVRESIRFSKAARLQPEPTTEEMDAAARADKWLYWAMSTEGLALFLVGGVLLPSLHSMSYLWPSMALIVGLHFYPLAFGFRLPVYYATATLICIVAVAAMIGLSGGYPSVVVWDAIVGISCAVALWGSCCFIIWNVRRIVAASR